MNSALAATALFLLAGQAGAQRADDYYRSGRGTYSRARYDSAVAAFEHAASLSDTVAVYHIWLARALGKQAEQASAFRVPFLARRFRREWERAVALAPADVQAREGMLEVYLGPRLFGGDARAAQREADTITALNPFRGCLARFRVDARQQGPDRLSRLESDARAAVGVFPDSAAAVNLLVDVLLPTRADEALRVVDSLVARQPADLRALYAFGRVSALTGGESARGEQLLRRILAAQGGSDSVMPPIANVYLRLGNILEHEGRHEEANREFITALELDPALNEARAALNRRPSAHGSTRPDRR